MTCSSGSLAGTSADRAARRTAAGLHLPTEANGHSRKAIRRDRRRRPHRLAHGRCATRRRRRRDLDLRQLQRGHAREPAGGTADPRVRIFEAGGDITPTDILDAALRGRRRGVPLRRAVAPALPGVPARGIRRERRAARSTCSRHACANDVKRLVYSLLGVGLRRRGRGADDRGPSVQLRELLRRDQGRRRGDGARRCSSYGLRLRRAALHERLRAAAGLLAAPTSP